MSAPVVWILAVASALSLIAGGFTIAVARYRSLIIARRREATRLGAQLESQPADPFGELAVLADQLRKIQQRLGQSEEVAGLPVQEGAAAAPQLAGAAVAQELEQDLDLFKKDVYEKSQRIDELTGQKRRLSEKVVRLESALAEAAPPMPPVPKPGAKDSNMALVDVLQGEADELRQQIDQRDQVIASLQASDTSGLAKEVGRIRAELLQRNDEVQKLRLQLAGAGELQPLKARIQTLEQEKEGLASRALEAAGQLRQANERASELEGQLAAQAQAPAMATPDPAQPTPRVPMPEAPSSSPAPPRPRVTASPRPNMPTPPPVPPRSKGFPDDPTVRTPRSPGFPDEPTQRTSPPPMTPPPAGKKKRKPTGSIFPPPRSKKDLLD